MDLDCIFGKRRSKKPPEVRGGVFGVEGCLAMLRAYTSSAQDYSWQCSGDQMACWGPMQIGPARPSTLLLSPPSILALFCLFLALELDSYSGLS